MKIGALIFSTDSLARSDFRRLLSTNPRFELQLFEAETPLRTLELLPQVNPRLALVDLGKDPEAILEPIMQLIRAKGLASTEVIGIYAPGTGTGVDPQYFLKAVRAGARDFLRWPADPGEVEKVLQQALAPKVAPAAHGPGAAGGAEGKGEIVVCYGAKGGVGTTTVAVNVVASLASLLPKGSICLVDAALQYGNAATYLDIAPQTTLADAGKNIQRLDADLLRSYLVPHEALGVPVLAAPRDLLDADLIDDEVLGRILLLLREMFRFTIVDTATALDPLTLGLLDLADAIAIVTEATLPSLHTTRRFLSLMNELQYRQDKVAVILNRFALWPGDITPEQVGSAIGMAVDFVVPYDRDAVSAANEGVPLVTSRPNRAVCAAITQIARALAGVEPLPEAAAVSGNGTKGRFGILGRLFGRKS